MHKVTPTDMERICRSVGMRPAKRLKVHGVDVFVADGFSPIPHITFQRFGKSDPEEFPQGAFVTLFMTEGLPRGRNMAVPMFFDAALIASKNENGRVNATVKAAEQYIAKCKGLH